MKGTSIITRGLVVRGRYAPYIQQLPEAFYTLDSFNNKEAKELQYTPRLTEAKNSLTTKRVDALYAKIKSLSPQTAKAVSKEQLQWAWQVSGAWEKIHPYDVHFPVEFRTGREKHRGSSRGESARQRKDDPLGAHYVNHSAASLPYEGLV